MPFEIEVAAIGGTSALFGVVVGGFITAYNQKHERRQRRISEQLAEFYSPMLALRAFVLAKSELRLKISGVADTAWRDLMENAREMGIEHVKKTREERFPLFEEIIADNNRQLAEEIMPTYHRMLELFTSKMHFAELSTINHYAVLLEFVDIWDRWLDKSLPHEVVKGLNHSEQKLYPLYEDVAANFSQKQHALREKSSWRWWWKPKASVKVLPSR
jgi:hypothetical protein